MFIFLWISIPSRSPIAKLKWLSGNETSGMTLTSNWKEKSDPVSSEPEFNSLKTSSFARCSIFLKVIFIFLFVDSIPGLCQSALNKQHK